MCKNSLIYVLIDPNTFEIRYVGLTINGIKRRPREHSSPCKLKAKTFKNYWIKSLVKTNQLPIVKPIQEWEQIEGKDLAEAEIYWISYFKKLGCPLTNSTIGGDGIVGYRHTDEARIKISLAGTGRKYPDREKPTFSEGYLEELSESMAGNTFAKGHKQSDEAKRKKGLASKGNKYALGSKHTEEWKKEASQRLKGNTFAAGRVPHNKGHRKSHCKHGHAYDTKNTYIYSNGKRKCRKCSVLGTRKKREKARNKDVL